MIPITFIHRKHKTTFSEHYVLAADVGGTKANLALYNVHGKNMQMLRSKKYPSQEYQSFVDILNAFIAEDTSIKPHRICVGVAGPVINNSVIFTNLKWQFSAKEIAAKTGVPKVALINDLEATAYGLVCIEEKDLLVLNDSTYRGGNIAIIAPGTGLGEAGMFYDGDDYHPFATEGGHSEFAPRTAEDIAFLSYMKKTLEIVSWEHVVSGPGIFSIFSFLRDEMKMEVPAWLTEELNKHMDDSAIISKAACEKKADICIKTMQMFANYLAHEAASLVLKLKATGGLFIGGGIPPKIKTFLQDKAFIEAFQKCDRMEELIKKVPVYLVLNDNSAMLGAAYYGAYGIVGEVPVS